jgi:hypothetical protein
MGAYYKNLLKPAPETVGLPASRPATTRDDGTPVRFLRGQFSYPLGTLLGTFATLTIVGNVFGTNARITTAFMLAAASAITVLRSSKACGALSRTGVDAAAHPADVDPRRGQQVLAALRGRRDRPCGRPNRSGDGPITYSDVLGCSGSRREDGVYVW